MPTQWSKSGAIWQKQKLKEHEFGWVFFYDTAEYVASGNVLHALAGNAPIIINRHTGELVRTGTGREIDYYVENYRKTGDPFREI
ncbi:MAG: hypothetical protein KDI71_12990 [Xanthomonadales bacterium]|nr:hypothetical protein [Xanthomonadales bacterium]